MSLSRENSKIVSIRVPIDKASELKQRFIEIRDDGRDGVDTVNTDVNISILKKLIPAMIKKRVSVEFTDEEFEVVKKYA